MIWLLEKLDVTIDTQQDQLQLQFNHIRKKNGEKNYI